MSSLSSSVSTGIAEGAWALPHGEYGLDVIALIGALRYQKHQSLTELYHSLHERGLSIGERTVLNLLARYEELVTIHMTDRERLQSLIQKQGSIILAVYGLRPDVGHEVLWVIRDCVSGEILLARPLLSEREADLVTLLKEVQDALSVPIHGVISDGQHSIRNAVATAFPEIPHQLCHFHYLREAAKPIYEADRHAKKELKKQVRGIRPIEREVEQLYDEEAMITRKYCLAVRSALTDDGHPPLAAPGLKLHERLSLITASLKRAADSDLGGRTMTEQLFERPVQPIAAVSAANPSSRTTILKAIKNRLMGECAYRSGDTWLIDTACQQFQNWLTAHPTQRRVKGQRACQQSPVQK